MEKIKGYLIAGVNVLILVLFGWIYLLSQKVGSLRAQVSRQQAEKDLSRVLGEKEKADEEASDAVSDFRRALSEYKPGNDV